MVFYTVPGDYLWLSLLKVFGQGLGPREVAQGQEFSLIYMFDQGFPGQQRALHDLRCYRETGRDKVWRQNIKTPTHIFLVHGLFPASLCHIP